MAHWVWVSCQIANPQALTKSIIPFTSDLVTGVKRRETGSKYRGRDAGYPAPPAQIRAGALTHTAPASGQTSAALSATCRLARLRGPQAACVTRTRHSVRYVLWPVDLPLAPVLRSIDSAGTLIPLFADFTATMTESDSSSPFVSGYDSSVFPSRPRH